MKKPKIQYTSTGLRIIYEEVGEKTDRFRIEIIKENGKLITKKIYERGSS